MTPRPGKGSLASSSPYTERAILGIQMSALLRRAVAGACLLLAVSVSPVSAEYETPLLPRDPAAMAQGGAAVSAASGYTALFSNPAGFVGTPGELTVLSARGWVHSSPARALEVARLAASNASIEPGSSAYERLERDLRRNGLGVGSSLGVAYVGRGLGLGLVTTVDGFLYGESFELAAGEVTSELTLIGGWAFPFEIGPARLQLGAAGRPLVRVHSLINAEETPDAAPALVQHVLGVQAPYDGEDYAVLLNETYYGYGLAIDAGAQLFWNRWSLGLAVRDIGDTSLTYSKTNLREVLDELRGRALPSQAEEDEDGYLKPGARKLPMRGSVGVGYEPSLGGWDDHLDARLQLEYDDLFERVNPELPPASRVGAGLEVLVRRRLALRAGLHQGYLTAGFGLDLPGFELNAAAFSRETGTDFRDEKSSTVALELAIRF